MSLSGSTIIIGWLLVSSGSGRPDSKDLDSPSCSAVGSTQIATRPAALHSITAVALSRCSSDSGGGLALRCPQRSSGRSWQHLPLPPYEQSRFSMTGYYLHTPTARHFSADCAASAHFSAGWCCLLGTDSTHHDHGW